MFSFGRSLQNIFLIFFLSTFLLSASKHPNPLSVLNTRNYQSSSKKPYKKPNKIQQHKVHYVASKRSLASYGMMKNEYLGPTRNNIAVKDSEELFVYTKHILTEKPYLELKAIDGPLPQDYFSLFIKAKSLQEPNKNYLKIVVNKSLQRIFVYRDLKHLYTFKTSTARRGYYTVTGRFRPLNMERMHYSRKYHNSPMPWSVFFHGGFAIHGTESIHRLGHPASHGCVRTHPVSARRIFNLIKKYGKNHTEIIVRN